MKVALVIPTLSPGGAQRVMTIIANHWAALGWRVHLLALDTRRSDPYFPLHPAVDVAWLAMDADSANARAAVANNLCRVRALRQRLRALAPDAVLSFIDYSNVTTLLASRGLALPVVVSERVSALHPVDAVWHWLRRATYPFASRVVVQTRAALAALPAATARRSVAIPNPIERPARMASHDRPVLAGVGRLVPQKGFDRLIEAFARAAPRHPDWSLVIWGEGPARDALAAHARACGVAERVSLPGVSVRPGAWIEGTGLFALSSRYEGFPNVLGEAMAAGLPAVAMDCVAGPAEMIRDGVDGVLVPADDIGALGAALDRLMADAQLRQRLGAAARESARQWAPDRVLAQWTELVRLAAKGRA